MSKARFQTFIAVVVLGLLVSVPCVAAEPAVSNAPPGAAVVPETSTNSDDTLRAYLQLQEQIHQTLLTIERSRQEAAEAAAKNATALADRMRLIEQSLALQRDSSQRLNHTMLIVVSAFAALGCVAVLLSAYLQWHTVHRLTAISTALPLGRGLGSLPALAALGAGDDRQLAAVGAVESSDGRLLDAIERLEKRINELERAPHPLADRPAVSNIVDLKSADGAQSAAAMEPAPAGNNSPASVLLGKGQSLLNLAKLEEAIACFDEVLALDPRNSEALVKKGAALERLRKPQEALECYDRAIAADSSMAIAYLYKGGLFNRMERFSEALECYEQALRTQEKSRAS